MTVYPGNALVTREVEVPPGNGLTELVIPDLPIRTMHNSLYSEGANGIRVLSTRFRTRPVEEDTREEVRKLEDERKKAGACGRVRHVERRRRRIQRAQDGVRLDSQRAAVPRPGGRDDAAAHDRASGRK